MENKDIVVKPIENEENTILAFYKKWCEEITKAPDFIVKGPSSKFRKLNKRKQKKILKRRFKGVLLTIDGSTLVNNKLSEPMMLNSEIGPQEIKLVTKLNISENY